MASPVRVALIDDYEVVLAGVGRMLERHRHRVEIVEVNTREKTDRPVDVVLYDTFAQTETEEHAIRRMVRNPFNRRVAVYTWSLQQELIDAALAEGCHGYLSKGLPALELVEALERISAGERVVSEVRRRTGSADGLEWPGRAEGVSDRESEILAYITQGVGNARIAELTHLSPNTIKTHIRSAYRKIGVETRVEAVIWGSANGFRPDQRSIDHWVGQH